MRISRFSLVPGMMVALTVALGIIPCRSADAQISFNISFNDPGAAYAAYYDPITSNLLAAGNDWSRYLVSNTPSSLEIEIAFPTNIPRATGRSFTGSFVGTFNGIDTFEQAAAAEIRTGVDPNGATGDIEINISPDYLMNELWFDPNPQARTAPVGANRTDAVSVLMHELGHAFVFNGWRDATTGALPGNYQSTFDRNVSSSGDNLFFGGANAMAVYGAPVPITYGNYSHIGNNDPRPGSDLIPDLMNGVVYYREQRYNISALDLAIFQDSGLAIAAVPEPSSAALLILASVPPIFGGFVLRRARVW